MGFCIPRSRLTTQLLLPLLIASSLVSCARKSEDAPPPLTTPPAVVAPSGRSGSAATATERLVAREVTLRLRGSAPRQMAEKASSLAESMGGFVVSSEISAQAGTSFHAVVALRIPSEKLSPALRELRKLGEVLSETLSGEDLTSEHFDVEARLAAKSALSTRLVELLASAKNVEDTLKIELELSRVRADIDQLKGQSERLRTQTSTTLVQLTIDSPEPEFVLESKPFGARLRGTLSEAGAAASTVVLGVIYMAVALSPLTLLGVFIALMFIWRARRRRQLALRAIPPRPMRPTNTGDETTRQVPAQNP